VDIRLSQEVFCTTWEGVATKQTAARAGTIERSPQRALAEVSKAVRRIEEDVRRYRRNRQRRVTREIVAVEMAGC
jgi:hypothetical protein